MASHYLSPEASRARVRALARRLAAEFSGVPVDAPIEWWFYVPALRNVVRCYIMEPGDEAALERALDRAAVS